MAKGPNPKAPEMPAATVTLACDECGERIAELPLNTLHLVTTLFAQRKEHARKRHGWQEETERCATELGR